MTKSSIDRLRVSIRIWCRSCCRFQARFHSGAKGPLLRIHDYRRAHHQAMDSSLQLLGCPSTPSSCQRMSTMNRYTLILLMLFHCLSQNSYGQNDWTRFRGPNGAGISMADSIPTTWTDKDYNWRVDVPGIGHSSPVVWKDRIFTTSADPNTGQQSVLCLHSSDGRTLWR